MIEEIWKPINGYEDYYEISSHGKVRSLEKSLRYHDYRVKQHGGVILTPIRTKYGFYFVDLHKDSTKKPFQLHRLVAIHFMEGYHPANKGRIIHLNGDRGDNRIENLKWVPGLRKYFDLPYLF